MPAITWMKNNEKVQVDNGKFNLMQDGSLMIKNTSDEDGGYYECMAKNADGEVKSRPARMTVVHPEEVTQGYGTSFSVNLYQWHHSNYCILQAHRDY